MIVYVRTLLEYVVRWPLLVAWMLLIFALSSIRIEIDAPGGFEWDKIAHVIEYAVLGFLITWVAWRSSGRARLTWPFVAAGIVLATLYGVFDEYYQSFVPGRDSSVDDVIADFVGAVVGSIGALLLSRFVYPQVQLDA